MNNYIEDWIFKDCLPVNTLVMANRLKEILDENNTNCALNLKNNKQLRRLIWLIASQVYGELAIIDMSKEWDNMYADYKKEE